MVSIAERLSIFWLATKCLFTGKMDMYKGLSISVNEAGISAAVWVKRSNSQKWQHLAVSFDGEHPAIGCTDGVIINGK